MACSTATQSSGVLDKAALAADTLAYLLSKVSPLAGLIPNYVAVSANMAAAGEELSNPNDVVPMNFFGEEVNVNADYVGFVAAVASAAEITALAAGVTVGSTVALGVTALGVAAAATAVASNDTFRDTVTDPAFWSGLKELLENGNARPISQYLDEMRGGDPEKSKMEEARNKFCDAKHKSSPIILDLDGDGVETTKVNQGAWFDHDGNGYAESTGWVGKDDGLLVRDVDGSGYIDTGSELFGNNTKLSNGKLAANGFEALKDLDAVANGGNADGKLDSNDAAWASLKVWKDANGDGYHSPRRADSLAVRRMKTMHQ